MLITDFPFSFFSLGSKLFKYVTLLYESKMCRIATVHLPVTIRKIIGRSSCTWVLRAFMGIGAEREERDYLNKVTHGGCVIAMFM
jgi:hypothetical protein